MAFWNRKSSDHKAPVSAPPTGEVIAGQPLFGLFNKLAMTPRTRDGGFVVQILGPRTGCGVSSIAAALAEFAALNIDGPVALVDADPFRLTQFQRFGANFTASLQDVQQGKVGLEAAARPTAVANLSLLALTAPLDNHNGHAAWTLSISAMNSVVAALRQHYQWVVVDSASARDLAFAHVLSRFMDGTVVVVESEKTRLPVAQQLIHQLRANGGTPLGLVINKRQMLISDFLYRFL